jgi:hypothetical protein
MAVIRFREGGLKHREAPTPEDTEGRTTLCGIRAPLDWWITLNTDAISCGSCQNIEAIDIAYEQIKVGS